ncbi:MAG: InlB B-repeat-containing protein, partial [Paludibacteraceae bacterium]|nr:InlB B-repeat-containing protein [Paludibacteraceae bacterium]
FVAVFTPDQYEVKTSSNNSSWGTTSGDGVFDYMSKTVIKAQPKEGYRFVMWEDGSISAERTITVPLGGATYNAIFAAETFHVEVVSSDLAKGTTKGTGDYENGQQVEIEAVANDGYVFTQWADGSKDAKRTVTVDGDVTYTAYFDYMQYDITAVAQDPAMGSVQGGGTYSYLDEVKLTAQAAEGYHFVEWSDGSAETERTIVVAVGGGTYTAIFAPNKYAITVDVDPASAGRGTVEGTGEYDFNSPVEIRAIAATGYHFVEWNDGNNDATRTVTVPLGGATYVATFTANTYTVTALSADETMGSVSGSGEYEYMSEATLVATPATGYHFVAWSDGVETAERTIKVEDNITLTATFASNDYTLTLSVEGEGTVMGAGTYKYGEQVEISAQAAEGYTFVGWSDEVTDAVRTITIEGDLELTARFEQITYTLTLLSSDEQMGQVSGAGTYPVNTEVDIEAVAFEHFRFVSWSDGNTEAKRTIVLTADLTLTAQFEVDDTALRNNKFDGEVSVIGREITVMLNQKHDVVVFAADGKCVAAEQNTQNLSVVVPQAGVYLVGIGNAVMRVAVY